MMQRLKANQGSLDLQLNRSNNILFQVKCHLPRKNSFYKRSKRNFSTRTSWNKGIHFLGMKRVQMLTHLKRPLWSYSHVPSPVQKVYSREPLLPTHFLLIYMFICIVNMVLEQCWDSQI